MTAIAAIDPATGETIKEYGEASPEDVEGIIEDVHGAFLGWRDTGFEERAALMGGAAETLRAGADEYAGLMAGEMGKPVREGRAEVEKSAWVCEYYTRNAEAFLAPEPIPTDASRSFVTFRPLGVVLAVMPWNFPFWQVFRFAAPALMAGNAGVLKHSSNVPGCAMAIEDIFTRAGFPPDVLRALLIRSGAVDAVIQNPLVKAVTLTGSTPAGSSVASSAGKVIKKTVLELGGSDPYVILGDADLEKAAEACVAGRLINAGQSCIAAKRLIVVESLRERFESLIIEGFRGKVVGDPMNEETDIGPMARADLRDELHAQVRKSIEGGAICLLGGRLPEGEGAYYPPTVITGVKKGMPAFDEELFGPVAAIIPVANEAEALEAANDTAFGLGAAVFTQDVEKGERIASEVLEAGCCFVNDFVRSDPRLPFGGIKESGYGRELSKYGIREFVNTKTVYVR